MLLNTRNFLLYLLAVAFLIVGIATTALTRDQGQEASVIMGVATDTPPSYEAEAVVPETVDRTKRLQELRTKIAALHDGLFGEEEPVPAAEPEPQPAEPGSDNIVTEPLHCASYAPYTALWNPGPVTFTVVEGARLVTREIEVSTTTASGTPITTTETEVIAQLPLRSEPAREQRCLPTDVVGIAKDGSLIRNTELGLYSVFGGDTLVGYALDGFPIYGTNTTEKLDACGGTSSLGQYRYFLSVERKQILNCFASVPIDI